jgi:hypothetical protein
VSEPADTAAPRRFPLSLDVSAVLVALIITALVAANFLPAITW